MAADQLRFSFLERTTPRRKPMRMARAGQTAVVRSHVPAALRSAVRVPSDHQQIGLVFPNAAPQLFVHEGSRQLLERRLATLLDERVVLSITDNRRTMVSSHFHESVRHVRLHHMFLDADPFSLRALARYVKRSDRASSNVIGQYIEANRHRIRVATPRTRELRALGQVYDLQAIFDRLNHDYFGGAVEAWISWGRQTSGTGRKRRHSIKLGSYSGEEKLIRVHPVLDQTWVPAYFIEFIVYHEMLHQVVHAPIRNGRQHFHTPEFRQRERLFAHYDRAIRWEKRWINRLLAG